MTQDERNRIIELNWFARGMELAWDMIQKDLFTVAEEILTILAKTCRGNDYNERRRIAWSTSVDNLIELWAHSDKGIQDGEKPAS